MYFGLCALFLSALLPLAIAQETGSVEGRVLSSTTHTAIGGATVTLAGRHAVTDTSGAFAFTAIAPGEITVSAEAPGFFNRDAKRRLDSSRALHLDLELTPHSSISGRVLDDEGHPLAGIHVEVTDAVRGTGTTWTLRSATTDADGRYTVEPIRPGTYVAMARPNPRIFGGMNGRSSRSTSLPPPKPDGAQHRAWVRTYYPSIAERSQAGKLILHGGTHLGGCDIRLLAPPVYAIRGTVYDDGGQLTAATIQLLSPDPIEMPETQMEARDGFFEFPAVPSGDWHLIATAERAGVKIRGVASATVSRHDLVAVTIRLATPFSMPVSIEPAPEETPKTMVSIELLPTDGPASAAAFSASSGGIFPAVYPGRYKVNIFGGIPDHYLDSILLGDQDVLGKEITLTSGVLPLRVIFRPDAAGIRGTVENCAGGSVLMLPAEEGLWDFRFIRETRCDKAGNFELGGLRPGDYYAAAFDRTTSTGLDDLATLRRIAAAALRTQLESGRLAHVDLKLTPWPE